MDISVVIPTYNRPKALIECLKALSVQDFSGEWELIVVDDGSTHPEVEEIQHFFKSSHLNIKWLRQKNQGPAKARNTGVEASISPFIAFIDDDCQPKPKWLSNIYHKLEKGVMIGGKTENAYTKNIYSEANQLLISFLYEYFKDTSQWFFASNNMAVCKNTFLNIGGFDTQMFKTSAGEDRELSVRWNHTGYKLVYNPNAIIKHYHLQNFKQFKYMHMKYGAAAHPYKQKALQYNYFEQKSFIEAWKENGFFIMKLLKYSFKKHGWNFTKKLKVVALLFMSQIFIFLGYLSAKKKDKNGDSLTSS